MIEIRWREDAEDDLLDIWHFIALDDLVAADRHIERLRAATQRLAEFPNSGHHRDGLPHGCRVLNLGRYLIIYRTVSGTVEIVGVQHGSRLFGKIAERL